MRASRGNKMKVVVVGAGLSGLSTAAFLRRYNIQCTVLEQNPQLHSVYAPPVTLWSNALTCFRAFDMGTFIDPAGEVGGRAPEDVFGIRDCHGNWLQRLANVDVQMPPMGEHDMPPSAAGPRASDFAEVGRHVAMRTKIQMARVPLRATFSMKYVKKFLRSFVPDVRFSKRVVDLVPIYDTSTHEKRGGVNVVCEDGDIIACDVVIGADGMRSMVRKLVYPDEIIEQDAVSQGITMVDGYVNVNSVPELLGTSPCEFWGTRKSLNYYPLFHEGQNRVAFTATLFDSPQELAYDLDQMTLGEIRTLYRGLLRKEFSEFGDEVSELFSNATVAVPHEVLSVPVMPQWHNRRAVLLGDAAHGIFPSFLMQDASLAVEDAAILATAIGSMREKRSDIIETFFRQYEKSRRGRVERYTKVSNMARDFQLARWEGGRNNALKCTPSLFWMQFNKWLTEWSFSHAELYTDPDDPGHDLSWTPKYTGRDTR